jgi:hypothetical protein
LGGPAWNSGAWKSVLKSFWAVLILENHVPGAFPAGGWFAIITPGGQLGVSPVGVGAISFGGRILQIFSKFLKSWAPVSRHLRTPQHPPKYEKTRARVEKTIKNKRKPKTAASEGKRPSN